MLTLHARTNVPLSSAGLPTFIQQPLFAGPPIWYLSIASDFPDFPEIYSLIYIKLLVQYILDFLNVKSCQKVLKSCPANASHLTK